MKRKLFNCMLTIALSLSLLSNTMWAYAEENPNTEVVNDEIAEMESTDEVDSQIDENDEDGNEENLNTEVVNDEIAEMESTDEADSQADESDEDENLNDNLEESSISDISPVTSNANGSLPVLSYEEFKDAVANGTVYFSNSSRTSLASGRKLISDITDKTNSVDEYNLNYELSVEVSNVSNTRTAPTPNIRLFVNNVDSLKDGSATTQTELIWMYNDSDVDGDTIIARLVEGFPEGYILERLNDSSGTEVGFVTRFFNPGTYTVDYFVLDSSNEVNGIRYTLDVVTVGDYSVYAGELAAEDEVDSYTVPIDFSSLSTAAITFVQSGETDLLVTIFDENGKQVTKMSSSNAIARRWYFINRPSGVNGIYNYTVTVAVNNGDYHAGSSDYRVMAGSKSSMEEMISYVDNAVLLGKYTATDSTYDFRTGYTPSNFDSYYKFTADGASTVTAMTNHIETRFKILDAETMRTLYDSEDDDEAHRTEYTSPFSYIEKERLGFQAGTEYYLVLYANDTISTSFVEDNITLTQGMGVLRSGRDVFTASSSITAGTSGYSSSATISILSGVPKTAEVKSVEFVSSDGVMLSNIKSFRVKAQRGLTSWQNSVQYNMTITYPYTADGSSNTPLMGSWLYGFQASLSSQTMTPKIAINYAYEYGD